MAGDRVRSGWHPATGTTRAAGFPISGLPAVTTIGLISIVTVFILGSLLITVTVTGIES